MKCPSCNKFAAFDTSAEPEVNLDVEGELAVYEDGEHKGSSNVDKATATVSGSVRIVLTAECCGDELKESNFDVSDVTIDLERAEGCTCDLTNLSVESSQELTDRSQTYTERVAKRGPNKGQVVRTPIPYRYQKRFYGAALEIAVSCSCGKTTGDAKWDDEVQASGMDELI